MKNKLLTLLVVSLILMPVSTAVSPLADPGTLPSDPLWGLDKAFDRLNFLISESGEDKSRIGLFIARERIAEIKVMLEKKDIKNAEKSKKDAAEILLKVSENIKKISDVDSLKELEAEVRIDSQLYGLDDEIKDLEEKNLKSRIKGEIPAGDIKTIEQNLDDLDDKIAALKMDIEIRKQSTRIRMQSEKNTNPSLIEAQMEENLGFRQEKVNDAEEELEDAEEAFVRLEGLINENIPRSVVSLIDQAEEKIQNAEQALSEDKYGEAFGQANAALSLLDNAENQLGLNQNKVEEVDIKAQTEEGSTEVRVEIGNEKLRFTIPITNREEVINTISLRLDMPKEDVAELIEFEDSEVVGVTGGIANDEDIFADETNGASSSTAIVTPDGSPDDVTFQISNTPDDDPSNNVY